MGNPASKYLCTDQDQEVTSWEILTNILESMDKDTPVFIAKTDDTCKWELGNNLWETNTVGELGPDLTSAQEDKLFPLIEDGTCALICITISHENPVYVRKLPPTELSSYFDEDKPVDRRRPVIVIASRDAHLWYPYGVDSDMSG